MIAPFRCAGDVRYHSPMFDYLFTDESPQFRYPRRLSPGNKLHLRLRAEKGHDIQPYILAGEFNSRIKMEKTAEDALFEWFDAELSCGFEPLRYRFQIETDEGTAIYQRDGAHLDDDNADRTKDFSIQPNHSVPDWAIGNIQYQILADRFANGTPDNNVVAGEYAYNDAPVKTRNWDELPSDDDYRCFYGGDLQGVMSKLDYLQSLGVETIYFNPLFVSPSSHKYDTQDYFHIDPHLAVICDDDDDVLVPDGKNTRYIKRTTSMDNLVASNAFFAELCEEMHRRGMKIILDGVFNHCGSFCPWMDREGIYKEAWGMPVGAFGNPTSMYREYFNFSNTGEYEAWWQFPTLPKLNYEHSKALCEQVLAIGRYWAMPPYSIDGWRLDVAADLGHSEEFNHWFWRRFRKEMKRVNPELLIIAEHYGNPSAWLAGDQWDSIMNYDAFMEPLGYFLTGVDKHSDSTDGELYQNGEAFARSMQENMSRMSWDSLACAMNELSNHDHSRFLTRTNGQVGRTGTAGPEAASENIDKRVMCSAVVDVLVRQPHHLLWG